MKRNKEPFRILCVCLGNTCRSPMIETVLREEFGKLKMNVSVESAGLKESIVTNHEPANSYAIEMMQEMGLDLRKHQARHVSQVHPETFDVFICVEPAIQEKLFAMGIPKEKCIVLYETEGGLADPYELGREAYVTCIKKIRNAIPDIIDKIRKRV